MSLYYPHQVEAAVFLRNHPGAMLWHDVRSGKTRAAILAARSAGQRLVAVVPAIARGVWLQEWEAVGGDPGLVTTLFGKTKFTTEGGILRDARLVIVGWDTLSAWMPFLRQLKGFDLALDESHQHLSNPNSQRWKATRMLTALAGRVALLSGTPYRTSAMDIFSQMQVLGPRLNPMSQREFGDRFCYRRPNPFNRRGWEYAGLRDEDQLVKLLPIHRVRESGQLPPRRVTWLEEPKLNLGYDPSDGASLARARRKLASLKAQRVRDLVYSDLTQVRPIVVFGWHHDFLVAASQLLGGAPLIDGSTPHWQRQELLELMAEGQLPVLVCQMAAAGVGVDMAAAQGAVFGELDWNESTHRQAEGRLRGPRQRGSPVYHYLVVRHSVEDYVWAARLDKGRAMDRLDQAVG